MKKLYLFFILLLLIPLVLGATGEEEDPEAGDQGTATYVEEGVQFYDGSYTYTLLEGKTFLSLEVENNEFYINDIAFCSSPLNTSFETKRDCNYVPPSRGDPTPEDPEEETPSSDSSTSETSTSSGSSDNDDYQEDKPDAMTESFLDSILINPTKAAIEYFQESPQNKITSISGMLIIILSIYFVSINFSGRKESQSEVHAKYVDVETKTYGKSKK
ncbi:MAG: hypothetical protein PHU51_03130 [Candidatus Nanoarchaeia archaeon]|nr:hypothetical protein [Candidatus Nanoarchaeia archaeon]